MTSAVLERLNALRMILESGKNSTQEEIRDMLEEKGFDVNQSTISRDLRKVGAIKATDSKGRTVYRLSQVVSETNFVAQSLGDLILSITNNDSLILIQTTQVSASLIARHLDINRPAAILGTIAGDDTIFVAPSKELSIKQTINAIRESI